MKDVLDWVEQVEIEIHKKENCNIESNNIGG